MTKISDRMMTAAVAVLSFTAEEPLDAKFVPPDAGARAAALGDLTWLDEPVRRALHPADDYTPIKPPDSGDWLDQHAESGQTYDEFLASGFNKPDGARKVIYLQPIGAFDPKHGPSLDLLKQYAAAAYGLTVKVLKPLAPPPAVKSRINPFSGKPQLLTVDLLAWLSRLLPNDSYCLIGVTMTDLYPEPSWNFVFGQATLTERVGVFSFARYDPTFYGQQRSDAATHTVLKRSLKVLVHELGHMFGLEHCIYYNCIMNGSNHLDETDASPMHFCPVCLRKLAAGAALDVPAQHRALYRFYTENGFDPEAAFMRRRIMKMASEGGWTL